MKRAAHVLLQKLKVVSDKQEKEQLLAHMHSSNNSIVVSFLNQHAFNLCCESGSVLHSFSSSDFLLRDGVGIKLACLLNRQNPGVNMNGTDFIPDIVEHLVASNMKVSLFVFGGGTGVAHQAAQALFPDKKVYCRDGYQLDSTYLDYVRREEQIGATNIVLLGMGMPKQEFLAQQLKESSNERMIVVCAGAFLEYAAGTKKRAPAVFRRAGLEWLYRLLKEPLRLFKRYVLGIPKFFYYVLCRGD